MTNSNVVQINQKRGSGKTATARNRERIPDEVFFFAGVLSTVALPEIIFSLNYGGLLPLIVFAIIALTGTILGVTSYYCAPDRKVSYFGQGRTMPQAPRSKNSGQKKAA